MNATKGKITNYKPEMAKEAAEMFNAFNELWPGGFTGGVPYTEQRVHDWLDKTSALADLIAINEKGELCGYCGLYPHWRDKHAAYISILGVTPKAKGKKFGKRLLLKSLEIAKEKGYTRVDLNTWSGNLDAVPLYKKIGLFWVPETQVYMQDYIPELLQMPILDDWFKKHPNWYSCFKRELTQAQDKELIDNMELYTYHFEENGDSLIAEVDRYGWGVCGFEKTIDNKKLLIKTRLKDHKLFVGIPNELSIQLYNDNEEEIEIDLEINAFKGLIWQKEFPKKVTLKKGELLKITREFILDKDVTLFKGNDYSSKKISSIIKLGKNEVNLITGGKIQTPISIKNNEEQFYKMIQKGSTTEIPIDLYNNTTQNLEGRIKLEIPELKIEKELKFNLEPEEITGISIPLTIPLENKKNKFMLIANSFIKMDNKKEYMPLTEFPIITNQKDLMEVVEDKQKERIYIITDQLSIRASLEGGTALLYQQSTKTNTPLRHSSGPPYGISLDSTLKFDYELLEDGKYRVLKLKAESLQIPGLEINKYYKITSGCKEIEYWVEYQNTLKKKSISVSARTRTASAGISINPFRAKGNCYTPINGKIIRSDSLTNFITSPLIPSNPEAFHETWSANEGLILNNLTAWIWNPSDVEKVNFRTGMLNELESKTKELQPNEIYRPIHLWYCFGFDSVQEIRNKWNQLVGHKEFPEEELLAGPKIIDALTIEIDDINILTAGSSKDLDLTVIFVSQYPLPGKLTLELPKGWKGGFLLENKIKKSRELPQLEPFKKINIPIRVTIPEKTKSPIENIKVRLTGEFDFIFNNYILVQANEKVNIIEKEIEGNKVIEVNNENLSFFVPKNLGGNLLRLQDAQGRSFLIDNFPEIKTRLFFEFFIGGLTPISFHQTADNPFNEPEKVKSEIYNEGEWQGVKSCWTIENEKEYLKGQEIEVKYLTLAASDIIRIIITQRNPSARQIPTIISLLADVALNGTKENNTLEVEGGTKTWIRNPAKMAFVSQGSFNNSYGRIKNEDQSLAFIVPKCENGSVVIGDIEMLIGWMMAMTVIKPHSEKSIDFLLLINNSREKMIELFEGFKK